MKVISYHLLVLKVKPLANPPFYENRIRATIILFKKIRFHATVEPFLQKKIKNAKQKNMKEMYALLDSYPNISRITVTKRKEKKLCKPTALPTVSSLSTSVPTSLRTSTQTAVPTSMPTVHEPFNGCSA